MTDLLLTPLDQFIRDQQDLTAVERFSRRHDDGTATATPAAGEARDRYRDLLPAAGPRPGEQYAFEVDLDACSGCKACVSACHHLNGLAPDETWRSVGVLQGASHGVARLQTVTTACHHCVDPACLNGCPVDAYEKDPVTGIVAHLDDQCIGCSYCTLMCPYEVPVYDHDRGIVRKCDLCRDRLAEGEAPACVQGCPTEAISIAVVTVADLVAEARGTDATALVPSARLVPSAPASSTTVPSTRYRSAEPLPPELVAADRFSLQPSHGHTPLAVMLVLTQVSVGAFLLALLLGGRLGSARSWTAGVTLLVGLVAVGASVLHLGRPHLAWRAVLGLRHSWLSREIVGFGAFSALATACAGARWLGAPDASVALLEAAVALVGVAAVACSVQIYAVTRRRWWSVGRTSTRFATTVVVGGAALLITLTTVVAAGRGAEAWRDVLRSGVRPLALVLVGVTLVELVTELAVLRTIGRRDHDELERTARLLAGDLRPALVRRVWLGLLGGVALPMVLVAGAASDAPPVGATVVVSAALLVAVVAGELAERRLYFLAVSSARMPGMLR